MRVYTEQKVRQLTEVVCNCCGKKLLEIGRASCRERV